MPPSVRILASRRERARAILGVAGLLIETEFCEAPAFGDMTSNYRSKQKRYT
jgi:hypothetical protein